MPKVRNHKYQIGLPMQSLDAPDFDVEHDQNIIWVGLQSLRAPFLSSSFLEIFSSLGELSKHLKGRPGAFVLLPASIFCPSLILVKAPNLGL